MSKLTSRLTLSSKGAIAGIPTDTDWGMAAANHTTQAWYQIAIPARHLFTPMNSIQAHMRARVQTLIQTLMSASKLVYCLIAMYIQVILTLLFWLLAACCGPVFTTGNLHTKGGVWWMFESYGKISPRNNIQRAPGEPVVSHGSGDAAPTAPSSWVRLPARADATAAA